MAYTPHNLVTLSGTLTEKSGQDEIWQIGLRCLTLAGTDPYSGADMLSALEAMEDDVTAWFGSGSAGIMPSVHLTQLKMANIGPDGKYTEDAQILPTDAVGSATPTRPAPSFCSLAYSFGTPLFGRVATHGRVYPPNFGYDTVSGTGTVAIGAQNAAIAACAAMLEAVQQHGSSSELVPAIISAKGPSAPIDKIRVGNVWDVQRRRKYAVPETYVAANYLPT